MVQQWGDTAAHIFEHSIIPSDQNNNHKKSRMQQCLSIIRENRGIELQRPMLLEGNLDFIQLNGKINMIITINKVYI